MLGILGAILLLQCYRVLINPPAPGDRWAFADTLGYDGDGPRDLQRKNRRVAITAPAPAPAPAGGSFILRCG
jgi:hypothetical protein